MQIFSPTVCQQTRSSYLRLGRNDEPFLVRRNSANEGLDLPGAGSSGWHPAVGFADLLRAVANTHRQRQSESLIECRRYRKTVARQVQLPCDDLWTRAAGKPPFESGAKPR